jgi:hypothetical protein
MKIALSTKVKVPTDATLRVNLKRKPKTVNEASTRETYPFSKMQVNQSFFVPDVTARDLRGAIYGATQRYNHRYISRSTDTGARVWRVK